jgi:hypothetical protein
LFNADNRVSDNRQKEIVESTGAVFDPQRSSPYWCFFGKVAAKALFGDESQLQMMNTTRIRKREFIAFTNATYQDRSKPIVVLEVDILKPRVNEPLEVFWKPARGIITQRVRYCESLF